MEKVKWNFKEKELQRVWATIADGVYSSSRSKAAQIRSPVLRYVHKALANTFFARKAPGQSTRGNSSFLTWESSPFSHAQAMARGSGEIDHTGNLMPFLDHLLTYKITAYNTRHQRGKALSVGGLITPILCAAGVNPTDREPLNQFTHPLVGPSKLLLPNPELTTVVRGENIDFRPPVYTLVGHEDDLREEEPELDRAEDRARRARIWGKPWKDAKVHGQDGEQDQEFGEEGFWFFKQEEEGTHGPLSLGVDHSSPLQGGSLPKSLTEPLLSSQGKEKTTRREGGRLPRPDAPARPPDSIESKQRKLNSIELRPWTPYNRFHQGQGATHTSMKKRKKRSRKLDRVRNPVEWSAPDGRLPSPDHDLASQFFGGH
ncbi:unnamed protein product [Microthlaspi erraticum]|uniref:Arabidopsis retrotransposon Orf1 C-terminal domain-containing protein n=1 Tax=Microthlaspi erraticum TaxID=1685480 RepID=A0A6D2JGR0_9BRAS|nr:unnamed protein product [Microthlaspi erraticum]